jgi:hypothetical protein
VSDSERYKIKNAVSGQLYLIKHTGEGNPKENMPDASGCHPPLAVELQVSFLYLATALWLRPLLLLFREWVLRLQS